MEIKTTIIIPNYNGLSFMEPCFESLKEQIVGDFKVLVVDNGSTDGSVEWLKEHRVPSIFLKGKYRVFRRSQYGDPGGGHALCASFEQRYPGGAGFVAAMERAMDQSPKIFFRQQPDDPDVSSGASGRCRRHVQYPGLGVSEVWAVL